MLFTPLLTEIRVLIYINILIPNLNFLILTEIHLPSVFGPLKYKLLHAIPHLMMFYVH